MTPIRTLVITHSTKPTGAPIALLRIMQWSVKNGMIEPTFVLRDTDELTSQFEALGPTHLMSARTEHRLRRTLERVPFGDSMLAALESASDYRLRRVCRRQKIQAIYVNTATQGRVVSAVESLDLPVVTHVHELERELRTIVGLAGIKRVIDQSHMLIAVSGAVRTMLLTHGANSARIVDVQEPIGDDEPVSGEERYGLRRTILGADDDTVVVAACGWPSWRKGTDLFLQVARHVIADVPAGTKVAFRWIGGKPPNEALTTLIDDISWLGLESQVVAIPHRPGAAQLLTAVDVFVSTSREDPNPLVVLEAAAAACPIVCFRDAGGAEELADAGGGIAVPYLDITAMASAIVDLISSSEARTILGDAGRRIVRDANTPETVAKKIGLAVHQCVAESTSH